MKHIACLLILVYALGIGVQPVTAEIQNATAMDRISREVAQQSAVAAQNNRSEQEQQSSWRKTHPVGFGALVGLGTGAGIALALAAGSDDTNAGMAALLFGAAGALIGALIGSFQSPE